MFKFRLLENRSLARSGVRINILRRFLDLNMLSTKEDIITLLSPLNFCFIVLTYSAIKALEGTITTASPSSSAIKSLIEYDFPALVGADIEITLLSLTALLTLAWTGVRNSPNSSLCCFPIPDKKNEYKLLGSDSL